MQKVFKLGVLLPHLGPSQASCIAINYANHLSEQHHDYDFTLFYEELMTPCIRPKCSTLNISEIWAFDGVLISSTINNTISAINAIAPRKKLFYVWDLEWLRGHKDYMFNMQAYRSKEITLIARSVSHASAISNYCNREVDSIIEDFNLSKIIEQYVK